MAPPVGLEGPADPEASDVPMAPPIGKEMPADEGAVAHEGMRRGAPSGVDGAVDESIPLAPLDGPMDPSDPLGPPDGPMDP